MPQIRVLPDVLASQVAAGEVVERPASAVKELVENSLDAGAGEVLVEIRRGGAALLRVTDDGCGMSREDALLSLERHATSKLVDSKGLQDIRTLGFRGEAVPSIASVSRFRLVSCESGAISGTEIVLEGGVVKEVKEAGSAPGTMTEVRDLFFNVPARRKFLRAETTESAHIEHQLRLHALASAGVRFRFRKDEREVFDLPAGMSRLDRVRWMLGTNVGKELVSVPTLHGNGLSVEGFLLPAGHARKGRKHQCVFLNGRPVEDAAISRGLLEGFRGGLTEGLHPAAWLWIEMEPKLVDVNVHPAKREIRLHRPHELREAIAEAVREALKAEDERRRPVAPKPEPQVSPPRPEPARVWPLANTVQAPALPLEMPAQEKPVFPSPSRFRRIGELLGRYAVLESEDGLVLLDPRAARERILYERWLAGCEGKSLETQNLLVPALFEPGPREVELLLRHRETFADAGFELEDFGGGTLQVTAVPLFFEAEDVGVFLTRVIDDLAEGASPSARFALDRLARSLARRAAIQEAPRPEEAEALLDRLFQCDLPYCAPDGRPTLTEFSLRELEKRFGGGGTKSFD
ncbi:DNA mismatch repair endonuclease MutL [Haloferula chungangensis]|uniref:DNA mismatch repair protein MutL n=1 Tax=Haloferula chungangensis TaxID=1048331 RepID=A0ABW2L379_9BACT